MTGSAVRRLALLVILIGAIQATLAAGLFGLTTAIRDSGREVPGWLDIAGSILATPGKLLSDALAPSLGNPESIYAGFGVGGVLWGCVIGLLTFYVQRRLTRRSSRSLGDSTHTTAGRTRP